MHHEIEYICMHVVQEAIYRVRAVCRPDWPKHSIMHVYNLTSSYAIYFIHLPLSGFARAFYMIDLLIVVSVNSGLFTHCIKTGVSVYLSVYIDSGLSNSNYNSQLMIVQ